MGDTSPILSKRTPTKTEEAEDEDTHHPVLPVDTDGTLAPADLVEMITENEPRKAIPYQVPATDQD